MTAGRRAGTDRVDALLLAGNADSAADADGPAQRRWDLEGDPLVGTSGA